MHLLKINQMKTDNYKLALFVPEKESQMPCDKCPISDICHAYNSYLVYNEIEHGDNGLLDQCLRECFNDTDCLIPVLQ